MKKLLPMLLSIMLFSTLTSICFASSHYNTVLLKSSDTTALEWATTNTNRSLFTAAASLDLMMATKDSNEKDEIASVVAFAAGDGGVAFSIDSSFSLTSAIFCGESKVLVIVYQPSTDDLDKVFVELNADYSTDLKMSIVEEALTGEGGLFYRISDLDFQNALDAITQVFES